MSEVLAENDKLRFYLTFFTLSYSYICYGLMSSL